MKKIHVVQFVMENLRGMVVVFVLLIVTSLLKSRNYMCSDKKNVGNTLKQIWKILFQKNGPK